MSSNAPPPQEPAAAEKRPCPKCGAHNPASAEFCWQCLSPLAGAAAAPGYSPPPVPTPAEAPNPYSAAGNPFRPGAAAPSAPAGGTAPATSTPAAPNPYSAAGNPFRPGASAAESVGLPPEAMPTTNELDKRMPLLIGMGEKVPSPASRALRIVIPLVVGAVAFFIGWRLFGGSAVEIPQEISGINQLNNTFTTTIQGVIEESLGSTGVEVRLGVFGENAVPSFMVLTMQGDSLPTTPEQNFQNFVTGFAEGSQNASIDTSEIQRRDFGGVAYLCAPGTGAIQAVCLWQRENVVGIVAGFNRDLAGTFQITIAAHDAIQG